MRARLAAPLVLAAALAVTHACTRGLIYHSVVTPLDTDLAGEPTSPHPGRGAVERVRYYVSVEWNSNAIGDIARRHGMAKIHYADLHTLSVLGVYTRQTVRIYGERYRTPPR